MKAFSKLSNVVFVAVLAFVVVAGSASAFALPTKQVHLSKTLVNMTGACCQDVPGETVQVTEPTAVAPVIVTWSIQYTSNGPFSFGVRLNGGGCGDYGPTVIPTVTGSAVPFTYQLVISPNDGLVNGTNTFQICVGPTQNNGNTLTLGERTLTVQIGK